MTSQSAPVRDRVPAPGDFACTPMAPAALGELVRVGEFLNGDGFANYEHSLIYVGRVVVSLPGGNLVVNGQPMGTAHGPVRGWAGAGWAGAGWAGAGWAGAGWAGAGWYAAEALPGGARLRKLSSDAPPSCKDFPDWIWSTGKLSPSLTRRALIASVAIQKLGTPYSAADYLALAAHRLHIPVWGLRGYIARSGHMICSQYVDYCWSLAGEHLFRDGRWPGYVTPEALADLLLPGASRRQVMK